MADFPELCDQQNDENEALLKRQVPLIQTNYLPGKGGPNPNFHDDGINPLKSVTEREKV